MMGFFSNGSEGGDYEHNVCRHCVHTPPEDDYDVPFCAVWELHLFHNYEDNADYLHALIPRQGIYNDVCRMFHAKDAAGAERVEAYRQFVERNAPGSPLGPEVAHADR